MNHPFLLRQLSLITALVGPLAACTTADTTPDTADETGGSGPGTGGGTGATDPGTGGIPGQGPVVVHPIDGVTVSTLAGSDSAGAVDGNGSSAAFNNPTNVELDPNGMLVVADFDNFLLRKVTAAGAVVTITGQAGFIRPFGMTFTPNGHLFVQTDGHSNSIATITNDTGALWQVDQVSGQAMLLGENLGRPRGLASFVDGRILMADPSRHHVRIMDPASRTITDLAGSPGTAGFADGQGASARFNRPYGAALRPSGDIVLADQANHVIRAITLTGTVSTVAGDGTPGMIDGPAGEARFNSPQDVAVDDAGNIYVSDRGNRRIRRIGTNGVVETVGGNGRLGFGDGAGVDAQFYAQEGLAVTKDGKTLYVADGNGGDGSPFHRIRSLTLP